MNTIGVRIYKLIKKKTKGKLVCKCQRDYFHLVTFVYLVCQLSWRANVRTNTFFFLLTNDCLVHEYYWASAVVQVLIALRENIVTAETGCSISPVFHGKSCSSNITPLACVCIIQLSIALINEEIHLYNIKHRK
jgi:hypothetical protein